MLLIQVLICFLCLMLWAPLKVQADTLYSYNLLHSNDLVKTPESETDWDKAIKSINSEIRRSPDKKWYLLCERASAKAHQGKYTEALNDLNILGTSDNLTEIVLSERAEVKSLLGFTDSALEDCDQTCLLSRRWQHLWHRSLILERAGRYAEAERNLQSAVRAVKRYDTENDIFAKTLLETAEFKQINPPAQDPTTVEAVIALLKNLAKSSDPPTREAIRQNFGIDIPEKTNPGKSYRSASIDSLWLYAHATDDLHQLHFVLNSDICMIDPAMIRKEFDAVTLQELEPKGIWGCGPGPGLMLYARAKENTFILSFSFDYAKVPALYEVTMTWKNKN